MSETRLLEEAGFLAVTAVRQLNKTAIAVLFDSSNIFEMGVGASSPRSQGLQAGNPTPIFTQQLSDKETQFLR